MKRKSRLSRSDAKPRQTRLESLPEVKQIVLTRWEGRVEECMKPVTVKSFVDAEKVLDMWRLSAPDFQMGYDKVGFNVTFKDGKVHKGRYDLNKANYRGYADAPTLEKHILAFRKYKAIK